MKGNQYRKLHPIHKGDRKHFCKRAKMNLVRFEKRFLRRAVRREGKKLIEEDLECDT